MTIERIDTNARRSRAVVYNHTVYLCGQVPKDITKGIQEQTQSTLANVEEVLSLAKSDKTKILSATIYLKEMEHFQAMNEVWNAWVPEGYAPARACVQANMAREGILIEISVIAGL